MATTLSRNLKLRINSNLTADARYNLERLDLLGATFLNDSADTLHIRSQADITIEPESADIGGSGAGGTLTIGSADHSLASVSFWADTVNFGVALGLADQAVGGTKSLLARYKSDLNGSVDITANRTLSFDLEGGDRNLILGGDLSILGGSLSLTLPSSASLTLPTSGTLSTLAGTETLTNKTISGGSNTITGITVAGGGTGASTATGALTNLLPSQTGNSGKFLQTNGVTTTWADASGGGGGNVNDYATNWITADGLTKVVTHGLGTTDVECQLFDLDDNTMIGVGSIVVTDPNTLTLTASEAPNTTWRVVVQG